MMQPEVLYEDNHLLAVNKPAGIMVQSDYRNEPSLQDVCKDYLKEKYDKPGNVFLGIVHRLDRQVSGTVIFARTSKAAERLSQQMREHSMTKIYLALCQTPDNFAASTETIRLSDRLWRDHDITRIGNRADAQQAELVYRILGSSGLYTLLAVRLLTGRKHQIRAQLAHRRLIIAGDTRYGATTAIYGEKLGLHCAGMGIEHPVSKEPLHIVSSLPDYMQRHCTSLHIPPFEEMAKLLA